MVNKKALWTFLALTFSITIILIIAARLDGFTLFGAPILMSQIVVLVAMFVPALSALFTQKFIVKKPLKELGIKIGPWSMYAKVYAAIVLLFIINYALTWLFILKPDLTLKSFADQYAPGLALPMPAYLMILIFSLITFIAAPILNLIPSLGEEIGWRGFLLPNLEPLGKIKAIVLSGMIWAAWHTPMILILGFTYGRQAWPGFLLHFIMVTGVGIWMGYVWFKTRSTVLAAFIHAVFNANAYGIWTMIFISSDKLLVGAGSLIGAALCLILGLITIYITCKQEQQISESH